MPAIRAAKSSRNPPNSASPSALRRRLCARLSRTQTRVVTPFVTYSVIWRVCLPQTRPIASTQAMSARPSAMCSRTRRFRSRISRVYLPCLKAFRLPLGAPPRFFGDAGTSPPFLEFNLAGRTLSTGGTSRIFLLRCTAPFVVPCTGRLSFPSRGHHRMYGTYREQKPCYSLMQQLFTTLHISRRSAPCCAGSASAGPFRR
jgi:hypothetical protein